MTQILTRRSALLGLSAAFTLGRASLALADAPTARRFVVIILRGALDGMAAIVPYGDPNLATWRPTLIPPAIGTPNGMLDLGGFYGLHPALAPLQPMYAAGDLLPIHAVAGHYRSRSHFEAQDYMESGADTRMTSGWLNRVATALPAATRHNPSGSAALSAGLSMPLLLDGPAPVASFAPQNGARPSDALYASIAALNAPDHLTGPAIAEALRSRGFSAAILAGTTPDPKSPDSKPNAFASLAAACGRLLAAPNGPRLAALEIEGWDTHVAQLARLNDPMHQLATGLLALQTGLGPTWRDTTILVMTEFGRTVRQNGSTGTDHGTGTVALVAGGNVNGGHIAGTWPGLSQANLFENRDLQPTTDLRSIAKTLLIAQYGLSHAALAKIFPQSEAATPMQGLIRQG